MFWRAQKGLEERPSVPGKNLRFGRWYWLLILCPG